MNRAAVWIVGLIVATLVALGGVGGFLLWRLDPKVELERQIETATGRDATIKGDVTLSFFPTLGVTASDVSLANAPGGRAPAMITAREVRVGVDPQALFDRRLVIRDLVLLGPTIALEVGADGAPNWIFPTLAKAPQDPSKGPLGDLKDVTLGDVRIMNGTVTFDDLRTTQRYALEGVEARAELATLAQPLTIEGSAMRHGERFELSMRFGEARRLLLGQQTSFSTKLRSPSIEGAFDGVLASGGAQIDGKVEAKGPSLRKAIGLFGDPLPEGGGLATFALSGQLAFDQSGARFENALFNLDGANGRGALRLETRNERPYLTGALQIAALDLNPYLAPPPARPDAVKLPAIDAQAQGWDTTPIDLSGLKGVDARVSLTTGPVKLQKMAIDGARGLVTVNQGVLGVRIEEARLYGGAVEGQTTIDARQPGMRLSQDLIFSNVAAAQFLKDAVGLEAIEGQGQLEITLAGEGGTQDALMRSLDGQVAFRLSDGALKGVNLSGVATTISRALRGEFVGRNARTKFSTFSANFTVADGVAGTRDLRLRAADAEITAVGAVDVGAQRLDLRIVPKSESLVSRMGVGLGRVAVPFHVSGPWTKPAYKTDLAAAAQSSLVAKVREIEAQAAARMRGAAAATAATP